MKQRIMGFDVARAIAIFGMVIVNFKIAMNANSGSTLWINFAKLFEGRASALFVILAGIGLTFLTKKPRETSDKSDIYKTRITVIKRGLLLILIGLMYTPIWEADILHFYGVYFLFAAFFFTVSDKQLFRIALAITLLFPILMLFFDYEKNWDWNTFTYNNFWSTDGMVRHIAFNGFHPVFPWMAFLAFGMWLGRLDLSEKHTRNRLSKISLVTLLVIEIAFYIFRVALGNSSLIEMRAEELELLLSVSIIPPLPQYIISASCSSVLVLMACLYFSEKFSNSAVNKLLYKTGQLSLTIYVAHVILGMGILESLGRLENQTIHISILSALIFCVCSVMFSAAWLSYFRTGPLEWIFRKVAS